MLPDVISDKPYGLRACRLTFEGSEEILATEACTRASPGGGGYSHIWAI